MLARVDEKQAAQDETGRLGELTDAYLAANTDWDELEVDQEAGRVDVTHLVHEHFELDPDDGEESYLSDGAYLIFAVAGNKTRCVRALLEAGATPDAVAHGEGHLAYDDVSALHLAAAFGFVNIVQLLIEHGADVNIVAEPSSATPIVFAADRGHSEIVALLLSGGARPDPFRTPTRDSALQLAARQNHLEIMRLLLEAGASVHFQAHGGAGDTALSAAASFGNLEAVELLLEFCADPLFKSGDGLSALALARSMGMTHVVEVLEEAVMDSGRAIPSPYDDGQENLTEEMITYMKQDVANELQLRKEAEERRKAAAAAAAAEARQPVLSKELPSFYSQRQDPFELRVVHEQKVDPLAQENYERELREQEEREKRQAADKEDLER